MFESTTAAQDLGFLRYACRQSPVGDLVVLMSEHGIVDIVLGDPYLYPLVEAARRYPGVGFLPDPGNHEDWVAAAVRRFTSPHEHTPFPVDTCFAGHSLAAA